MNITTDQIVESYIASNCPLKGALYCDYVTTDNFSTALIHESYKDKQFPEDHRPALNLDMARGNFWRLVRKYACPTKYEVGIWVKCLLRHCYALGVTAVRGKGDMAGQTLFPLQIFDDPNLLVDMMNALSTITQNKLSPEMDGAELKNLLSKADGNRVTSYAPMIRWLAAFFWGPEDEEGKKHIDLNDYREVAGESIITLMYNHIKTCVNKLQGWHDSKTTFNASKFEQADIYTKAWQSILPQEKGHDSNKWLRYPSMLVSVPNYSRKQVQVTDQPMRFMEMSKNETKQYEQCQQVLFYSDYGTGVQDNITSVVHNYIQGFIQAGLPLNTQFSHTAFRLDAYKASRIDTIEIHNHGQIRLLVRPELGSPISDTTQVDDAKEDESLTQQTPGGTDKPDPSTEDVAKMGAPKKPKDKKKPKVTTDKDVVEKKEKENTNVVLLIAGAALLFVAFM